MIDLKTKKKIEKSLISMYGLNPVEGEIKKNDLLQCKVVLYNTPIVVRLYSKLLVYQIKKK